MHREVVTLPSQRDGGKVEFEVGLLSSADELDLATDLTAQTKLDEELFGLLGPGFLLLHAPHGGGLDACHIKAHDPVSSILPDPNRVPRVDL